MSEPTTTPDRVDPYLVDLTIRVARGVEHLPAEQRERQAEYIIARQQDDGGFAGREGPSDLYYTGFALRSLAVLGRLDGPVAERAAALLASRLQGSAVVVDLLSLIYGAELLKASAGVDVFDAADGNWRRNVAATLERLRRDDGGYSKSGDGSASSTYYTFLVVLCLQMMRMPLVDREAIVRFVMSQRREDGGFVEIRPMRRSGANPTAAAIGLLRVTGALSDDVRDRAAGFLSALQTDEGGVCANTRIAVADLLSTFTAIVTLADLNELDAIDSVAVADYVQSLERHEGGFQAASWDAASDVEYTFYGLASLALLALHAKSDNR